MGMNKITDMTKDEYAQLKKSQRTTRIAGLIIFAMSYSLFLVFALSDMLPFGFLFTFGEVIGLVLLIRSFVHVKYAPLKYAKFYAERMKDKSFHQNKKTIAGSGFADFGSAEKENNRILGCLLGGAAGDALGYSVEFIKYDQIKNQYGQDGITSYSVDPATSKAIVSDDTQMTLFTAEGLLREDGDEIINIYNSYQNWLITQQTSFENRPRKTDSELMNRPELFARRAPGNTCLSALSSGLMGTVLNPINSSKGCGGVMRVAPIAFINYRSILELDKLAARTAAITHGHPLGYLPAALLVHIIHTAIYENADRKSLMQIITESTAQFAKLFSSAPYLNDLVSLVNKAIDLSKNRNKDIDNIKELGEGWVAEETLAIAVYCALRYHNSFSKALAAAVNHDGDSDSTGAVTGNILGAYLGKTKIDAKWYNNLELFDILSKMAASFQS